MACNCLEKEPILTRLREQKPDLDITEGDFVQVGLILGKQTSVMTFTEFEYTFTSTKPKVKAQSKPRTKVISLHHKYCPFCGVEYNPEETEAVNADKSTEDVN